MESVLEDLAADEIGNAKIGIVPESERDLFSKFGVTKLPTTLVFHNGAMQKSLLGYQEKNVLAEILAAYKTKND
jgi:thioredoxin-like negative regulator of GroEL